MGQERLQKAVSMASGGFEFPRIYSEDKAKLKRLLIQGRQDLVELSRWSLADDFMHYILEEKFLEFADKTYPTPRSKTEVPVWFLICSQLVLHIHNRSSYTELKTFLKAGTTLSRVGYNVGRAIGFNEKNKKKRNIPCDQDTVRKFFKDTNPQEVRQWFCTTLQSWFLKNNGIDSEGVFVADQSHIVVPDNKNYKDAVRMPVDEHGQLYKGTKEEIAKYKWHPCYTVSTLLNLKSDKRSFHIAGYELGAGNEDEFPQAENMMERFIRACGKKVVKLLIVDRGYVSGEFINLCKTDFECDVLLPLKTNMAQYQDAIALANLEDTSWEIISDVEQENKRDRGVQFKVTSACTISDIKHWDTCKHPLYVTVIKNEEGDNWNTKEIRYFVLCSTRRFPSPFQVYQYYRLRSRVEEIYRQVKHVWQLIKFPSPNRSLMEVHVGFIFLTYSLLNLYLRKTQQTDLIGKFLSTVQKEAMAEDDEKTVISYADNVFGVFSIKEYLKLVCELKEQPRKHFLESLNAVNQL